MFYCNFEIEKSLHTTGGLAYWADVADTKVFSNLAWF
jgi:hypothetical protein